MKAKVWIEAMRLRTLPVSVAGVLAAAGCAAYFHRFNAVPFLICLLFAVVAQIVSNFANEYFDFRNGLDRKGREGFRRGVTEGDISPRAMKRATFTLLALDCLIGLSLIFWGGWWMLPVGVAIALFAIGYSAGPYPLSHHGLGEIAVFIFFGIVPVMFTTYLQTGTFATWPVTLPIASAVGFMACNVLIINNYRDRDDDLAVGKRTLAVQLGPAAMRSLYLTNGFLALAGIEFAIFGRVDLIWQLVPLLYINLHYLLWRSMCVSEGSALNPVLGKTAMLMLAVLVLLALALAASAPAIS